MKPLYSCLLFSILICGCASAAPPSTEQPSLDARPSSISPMPGQDEADEIVLVQNETGQYEPVDSAEESVKVSEDGLTFVHGILLVNKKHGVPDDYAPGMDLQAQSQCSRLIADMQEQGMNVSSSTTNYRSYPYQSELYDSYVSTYGQEEADTFSARPGYSEHQTGLAFDLLDPSGQLLTSPAEAQWLLDHAAEYGFIVRYPQGKENITGYQAEPWHIRYIGEEAEAIAASGLTLEEYLGVEGGDYQHEE